MRLFEKLSNAMDLVNDLFTLSIFLNAGYCLMVNVIIIYSIIHSKESGDSNFIRNFQIFSIEPLLGALASLAVPIYYSVNCVNETKVTSNLVNELMIEYQDDPLVDTIKIFSRQISQRERKIACAFAKIDWTLFFSVSF
jgi:hypothetical protein